MNFSKAKDTYRKNAIVQRLMAKKLISEVTKNYGNSFDNILEIGTGTGLLTDEITSKLNIKKLYLNDLTKNFTGTTPCKYYQGDILEILKCGIKEKFNLIISNAVFQWIDDKEELLLKLKDRLQNKGLIAFSSFGHKNFCQIKHTAGLGLNYESFAPLLKKTGFKILYFEEELETLYFKDMQNLLEHIRLTGVGTSKTLWTKQKYEIFKEEYLRNFSDENGVELTYHPVYYICALQHS